MPVAQAWPLAASCPGARARASSTPREARTHRACDTRRAAVRIAGFVTSLGAPWNTTVARMVPTRGAIGPVTMRRRSCRSAELLRRFGEGWRNLVVLRPLRQLPAVYQQVNRRQD